MSMYGKDRAFIENEQRFRQDRDYLSGPGLTQNQNYSAPSYSTTTKPMTNYSRLDDAMLINDINKTKEASNVQTVEQVECTPFMWSHPMGLLRWFQLIMFFILQWLVQITCGGDACTMIMNVFGYTAMGQLFVLVIFLGLSMFCALILLAFILNAHKSFPSAILAMERIYAILGIVFMFIAGILGTWMAVLANNPDVNYQGRGRGHIQGQWIAAAVLEFIMVFVYVFDLLLQRRENYPFTGKEYKIEKRRRAINQDFHRSENSINYF
ncbi:unnamed protein product [Caenorhabditis angaria]|uniref:MARVEL domain-containing protein n=1 Tax=Caenorhabditis angaria TaxID=860376 RepID=A0A9P1J0T9_9PELO|nr:unnamed protein product [Caenorhabditis angaria]